MHDQLTQTQHIETMSTLSTVSLEQMMDARPFWHGKVRDVFGDGDDLIFVTTDRVSAFDQVLGEIPGKGVVNNLLSEFWFNEMKDVIPNHMRAVPDPNVMIGKKLTRVDIEVVVRGYMTGVTDTSIWGSYQQGERNIYGIDFRDGYRKNDQLDEAIITPTTKEDTGHDQRLTDADIRNGNVEGVSAELWDSIRTAALTMFTKAQEIARTRGYILVDTKMEFGMDEEGNLYIMDELFTPDSSRYWKTDTYEQLITSGQEPENYDKEYLRIALKNLQKQGIWEPGKPIPHELVMETARRYMTLFEELTGRTFPHTEELIARRITRNMHRWLETKRREETEHMDWGVIVLAGSGSDEAHVNKITGQLEKLCVPFRTRVGSVHKTFEHLGEILGQYQLSERQLVFITVAGGVDALSGTADGSLPFPVISAPPEGQSDTIYAANLHTPKGIAPAYVIRPENAAIAAAKILALSKPEIRKAVELYQQQSADTVITADKK